MRYPLILLLLLAAGTTMFAQAPGYMGKRFTFLAEGNTMFVLNGITANNRGLGETYGNTGGGLALSGRYGGQFGFALSRKHQLTLGMDYTKTGMILNELKTPTTLDNGNNDYDIHYLFYNLNAVSARVGMRFFNTRKAGLAPMGSYNGWSIVGTRVKGEILDKQTYYPNGDGFGHRPLGINPVFSYLSLAYEGGVNWVIADRILLNVGTRIAVPFQIGRWIAFGTDETQYIPGTYDNYADANQLYFEDHVLNRISFHSMVTIYGGIGLLLF
jgi:hypothetical protein